MSIGMTGDHMTGRHRRTETASNFLENENLLVVIDWLKF